MLYSKDVLLELTYSLTKSMSEAYLLTKTLSFYNTKLNGQASIIYPTIKSAKSKEKISVYPKEFKSDKKFNAIFTKIHSSVKRKQEHDLLPIFFQYEDLYISVYKLSFYGFFVMVKLTKFPSEFARNLIPVFQLYGFALTNAYDKVNEHKNNTPSKYELNLFKEISDNSIHNETIYDKEIKNKSDHLVLVSQTSTNETSNQEQKEIATAFDLSKNLQNEQDFLFFKEIINQSIDAVILSYENGHFYYCNSTAKAWLGIQEEDFLNTIYQDVDLNFINTKKNLWKSHVEDLKKIDSINSLTSFVHQKTQKTILVDVKKKHLVYNDMSLILSICRDTSEHLKTKGIIADELKFQNLLLKVSSNYINTSLDDIENTIQQSLKEIGLFVKADRSYIFDYDDALETSSNTFEWCNEGISPQIENLQKIPTYNLSDWLDKHQKGLPFLVENLDDLPDHGELSLRDILSSQGIKSLLTIPMLSQEKLVGFVGFDSVKEQKHYSEKEKKLLSLYADLLVNIKNREKNALAIKNQEERFKSIIQSVDLGLIEVNENFEILFVNENLTKLYEYEVEEVLGANVLELFLTDKIKNELLPKLIHLNSNETLNLELPTLTKSRGVRYIYISIGIKTNDQAHPIGFTGALLDVTTQKKLEQDLKLAKEKAEYASLEKDRFLANMSHEMRTPLNIINGMISELLLLNNDSSDQTFLLKQTKDASNHLLNLVNNVLDMAKINAGEMNLTNSIFDLRKLVEDSFSILSSLAKERNIKYELEFKFNLNCRLKGDSLKISQVLVNLLNNAIKYTHKGGVNLVVDLRNETNSYCEVEFIINDTGIGMSQEFLDVLFTEFSTENQSSGSTGLGMPIAKKIIDLMGGSIDIQSTKGNGTKVAFILKFEKSEHKSNNFLTTKSIKTEVLAGKNILVVEDNQMNALIAKKQLERKKALVTCKYNGLEAIEYLLFNAVDLILMDIQMPLMDGIQCTSFIKNELNLKIPIIALTANVFKNDLEHYLKIGINDYLTKPFKEDALLEKCCIQLSKKTRPKSSNSNFNSEILSSAMRMDRIDQIAAGDEVFKRELIDAFACIIKQSSLELIEIDNSKNLEKLKHLSHKIKPSLHDFGLYEFTAIIKQIMKAENFKEVTKESSLLRKSLQILSFKLNANKN